MDTMNVNDPGHFGDVMPIHFAHDGSVVLDKALGQLIDSGQKERALELLEAAILKGIDSGPAEPWTREDLAKIRAEVILRYESRKAEK
jgi:hypothetical protein